MNKNRLCYGADGLDGIDIPEPEYPFISNILFFAGMSQDEIEAEADREEEALGYEFLDNSN